MFSEIENRHISNIVESLNLHYGTRFIHQISYDPQTDNDNITLFDRGTNRFARYAISPHEMRLSNMSFSDRVSHAIDSMFYELMKPMRSDDIGDSDHKIGKIRFILRSS